MTIFSNLACAASQSSLCDHFLRSATRATTVMTLYIVESSALIRERLALMIAEIPGLELIGETAHLETALREIPQLLPQVLLLDLRLDRGSGLDILTAVKQLSPPPVVIVQTGFFSPQIEQTCLNRGADFVVGKLEDFDRIEPILHQLLSAHRTQSPEPTV